MEKIQAVGAGFKSLTESIDTTTSAGLMLMQMVGSFAEFERAMIRERTITGMRQLENRGASADENPNLLKSSAKKLLVWLSRAENPHPKPREFLMSTLLQFVGFLRSLPNNQKTYY